MKRQKQIDASKQMIASAFFKLLRAHDFNEITLSEIAAHAGVTRMTLYRHFKSKEKIILYKAQTTLEEIKAKIPDGNNSMKELIFHRLELIKNLPHLAILLRSREIEEILNKFRMESFKEKFERLVGHRYEDDPYTFHFYFGGINSMIREWLKNDCRESSREMTDRIISISRAFKK
jgi:AcrR family transcriptional regulator